jgi:DNA-binding MarR family transcriptional regulator
MATPLVPDDAPARSGRRAELLERLALAGRESSVATVMFHTAVAARQGLSASEEKALDLLERSGALTAGELARQTGLAPASVTGLINRLERKGFARRVPNPEDRRSVLVEVDAERLYARVAPLFGDWIRSLQELFAGYTDDQLEVILHFLTEAARRQQEATTRLTDDRD